MDIIFLLRSSPKSIELEVGRTKAEATYFVKKVSNEKIRQSTELPAPPKLRESTKPISNKTSCSSRIYIIRIGVRVTTKLADLDI